MPAWYPLDSTDYVKGTYDCMNTTKQCHAGASTSTHVPHSTVVRCVITVCMSERAPTSIRSWAYSLAHGEVYACRLVHPIPYAMEQEMVLTIPEAYAQVVGS